MSCKSHEIGQGLEETAQLKCAIVPSRNEDLSGNVSAQKQERLTNHVEDRSRRASTHD